jgi:2,3-bisphosphoglycerate-independent phosphoglycerate mutase
MKYIIFVGDGMGDYPVKELDNKTPLQVADTPNMDFLVKKANCGKLITIPEGLQPGSAVANMSILGYDPKIYFTGRGALEAPSVGVKLTENDIVFRCNLITEKDGKVIDYSSGHITTEESKELMLFVNKKLGNEDIKFFPGISYRHILTIDKNRFSEELVCNAPHDFIREKVTELLTKPRNEKAKETANMINKIILDSKDILEQHPINIKRKQEGKNMGNMVWPWSPGTIPKMKTFKELYNINGAVISAVDLIFGIGHYAGLDPIHVKGATGLYDTNYEGKADATIKALEKYDFVFVHVEAIDEASHAADLKLKIKTIEDFDKRLIGNVLKKVDLTNTVIAVTPDHATPIEVKTHTRDPVPFLIYKPNVNPDSVKEFNEYSTENGNFGIVKTIEFIKIVLENPINQ